MAYSINVPANTSWSMQTVTLDGAMYNIELRYKERQDRWYISIYDIVGNNLLREAKCVAGQTMTGLFNIDGFTGNIMIERQFGTGDYPTRDNFGSGKEFEIVYMTTEEFNVFLSLPELEN